MGKLRIAMTFATALVLAVCLGGCSSESGSKTGGASKPTANVTSSLWENASSSSASASAGNAHALTTPENSRGKWDLIRLDYSHKEGGKNVMDGRYEGDGVLTITETGYNLTFSFPDGNVLLEASGTFTTGAQATFIGSSTVKDYPVAMFGGFGSGIVMKFTDGGQNRTITVMGSKR